jgi:hypothetical protein
MPRPETDHADRTIAVLLKALSVCRGMLYSARTGDAGRDEIERVLASTAGSNLAAMLGPDAYERALALMEDLPRADAERLLGIE